MDENLKLTEYFEKMDWETKRCMKYTQLGKDKGKKTI